MLVVEKSFVQEEFFMRLLKEIKITDFIARNLLHHLNESENRKIMFALFTFEHYFVNIGYNLKHTTDTYFF